MFAAHISSSSTTHLVYFGRVGARLRATSKRRLVGSQVVGLNDNQAEREDVRLVRTLALLHHLGRRVLELRLQKGRGVAEFGTFGLVLIMSEVNELS